MSPDEIHALAMTCLIKWKPRLHLREWKITLEVVPLPTSLGKCDCDWQNQMARIQIADDTARWQKENTWKAEPIVEGLIEFVIVHELLHIIDWQNGHVVENEVSYLLGDGSVTGAPLLRLLSAQREWWVNAVTRVLLEADQSSGWAT